VFESLEAEKASTLIFELISRGFRCEGSMKSFMLLCLRNWHVPMAWSCALSILLNRIVNVEEVNLAEITYEAVFQPAVPTFFLMSAILMRLSACSDIPPLWVSLADFVMKVIADICHTVDLTSGNLLVSFCSILGMLDLSCEIASPRDQIVKSSEYVFRPIAPYTRHTIRLVEKSESVIPSILFADICTHLTAFGEVTRDRLNFRVDDFCQCVITVLDSLEGNSVKIKSFLTSLLLVNPFCSGDSRWQVLNYIIQKIVHSECGFDTMSIVFDFCCDRIIEGCFAQTPNVILSPMLAAHATHHKRIPRKLMMAIEMSVLLIDGVVLQTTRFSLISLFLSHQADIFQRMDLELAVALVNCLARFWSDPGLRESSLELLGVVFNWMTEAKIADKKVFAWVRTMVEQKAINGVEKPETTKLDQELVVRQEQTVFKVRAEIDARIRELKPASEKCVSGLLGDFQREIWGWKLDAKNQRILLEMSFGVDVSAYYRAREKANVFAKFADFAAGVQSSNAMRMKIFRIVFGLSPEDQIFPVIVEISGAFGKGLFANRAEVFYLITGMDEHFGAFSNTQEFETNLRIVSGKCNYFEGHIVVPFTFSGIVLDQHATPVVVIVPYRELVQFRIRPLHVDSGEFATLIARLKAKLGGPA
jgi:hypothetical protein